MNKDLTTKSLFWSLLLDLIAIVFAMLIITVYGILLTNEGVFGEDSFLIFIIGYSSIIVLFSPYIISWVIQYKRFKKALKSCEVLHGNLNEVDLGYTVILRLIFSPFVLGFSLVINGQGTPCIYWYRLVKKSVNTRVSYIFDGDRAYLLRQD